MEVDASGQRQLDGPEFEARRKRYEITGDELGIRRTTSESHHIQLEVECTIEGWRSLDVKARTVVTHRVIVALDAVNLEIPKVRKPTNEIKDLFVTSPREFQYQGLQGPRNVPHLWNEQRGVQRTGLGGIEVREGTEALDAGV